MFARDRRPVTAEVVALRKIVPSTTRVPVEHFSRISATLQQEVDRGLRHFASTGDVHLARAFLAAQNEQRAIWLDSVGGSEAHSVRVAELVVPAADELFADVPDGTLCTLCTSALNGSVVACTRSIFHRGCAVDVVAARLRRPHSPTAGDCPCGCAGSVFMDLSGGVFV